MKCIVCGAGSTRPLTDHHSPYVDFDYTLYECPDCASRFFDPDQHPVDLKAVYEKDAEANLPDYGGAFKPIGYWKHQVSLIGSLAPGKIRSVLDVGCRTGDFLLHWPGEVSKVGVELSDASATAAEKRGLVVKRAFLEDARFDGTFDLVSCFAVVEHLREPKKFLERLSSLTAPGGMAVIMIPTFQCLKERIISAVGMRWHMYCPPQHLNFLSRDCLDDLMTRAGYRRVARRYGAGGMFNPFSGIPFLGRAFHAAMERADAFLPLNRLPLFDHMYSYYVKLR